MMWLTIRALSRSENLSAIEGLTRVQNWNRTLTQNCYQLRNRTTHPPVIKRKTPEDEDVPFGNVQLADIRKQDQQKNAS